MTYEEFKQTQTFLNQLHYNASVVMSGFSRLPNGLTPDETKMLPEWQAAKKEVELAFRELRNFNGKWCKHFKHDIAKEHGIKSAV